MKTFKKILVTILAVCCVFALAACGDTTAKTTAAANTTTAAEATTATGTVMTNAQGEAVTVAPGSNLTYKDIMVPFDKIVPTEHIVLIQNALQYTADGFYTRDTAPKAEEVTYKDAATKAYAVTHALNFLTYGYDDGVTVYAVDGATTAMTKDEIAACYFIIDFQSDAAPVLYNPTSKVEIAFAYLTTAKAEGLYSIPASTNHNTKEITDKYGWDTKDQVRMMATDKFHIPVPTKELSTGELRGTLSGAINGSWPELTVASGKLNDVLYLELLHAN